jgi:hypothetical protein
METYQIAMLVVAAVILVLYMMRRKNRLNRDD